METYQTGCDTGSFKTTPVLGRTPPSAITALLNSLLSS
jgi:hypothetical protein